MYVKIGQVCLTSGQHWPSRAMIGQLRPKSSQCCCSGSLVHKVMPFPQKCSQMCFCPDLSWFRVGLSMVIPTARRSGRDRSLRLFRKVSGSGPSFGGVSVGSSGGRPPAKGCDAAAQAEPPTLRKLGAAHRWLNMRFPRAIGEDKLLPQIGCR